MSDLFGDDFFRGNRERLRALFTGTAPIVITGNCQLQKNSDEAFPFYQDRDFWYLTGIDEPDAALVLDKNREYLIVPERDAVREAFEGAVDFEALARRSGIADVVGAKDGWRQLEARVRKVKHVATLAAPPQRVERWNTYTNPARAELIRKLKTTNAQLELLDLRPHLSRLRTTKQAAELEALQRAVDVTIDTIKEITRPSRLGKYAYEYEIEADLARGFRRRAAAGHAFSPIVASGQHACTIHYASNNGQLASDELVLLDVGAEVNHYAADISRTLSLSGRPSRRQQLVFEAVNESLQYAFSLLKPGVLPRDYEQHMQAFVGEKLRELNLIKSIDRDAVRRFFPHRTSHFLGLETHDAGDYDRPFEPGMVLAVEPGIYIPEEAIGVRVEDDVLITTDGVQVLTDRLPREL